MEHHLNFDQKTFQVFLLIINNLIKLHLNRFYLQIQRKFNTNLFNIHFFFFCRPTSSWNTIVSAPRPRSTSPHSIPSSQDQRSDRSRSFHNKLSSNNERKLSNKKSNLHTPPNRASKINSQEDQQRSQSLTNSDPPILENNIKDDGFIQTKQQHRRLKRKNKIKEESPSLTEQSNEIESAPYALDDENAFPTLGQQVSISNSNKKSENDPESIPKSNSKSYQVCLNDMFNSLSTSTQVKQQNSHYKTITSANPLDSKSVSKREQPKPRKSTKLKRISNKEVEEKQQLFSKLETVEKQSDEKDIQNETDTNTANVIEK